MTTAPPRDWAVLACSYGTRLYGLPLAVVASWQGNPNHRGHRVQSTAMLTADEALEQMEQDR